MLSFRQEASTRERRDLERRIRVLARLRFEEYGTDIEIDPAELLDEAMSRKNY